MKVQARYIIMVKSVLLSALLALGVLGLLAPRACQSAVASDISFPIVLVPGIIGNQIEAKLNKPTSPHVWCEKTHDWFTLWLEVTELLPEEVYCFADNMMLHYDPKTGNYSNTVGVQTRVPDFGGTSSVEYLDPHAKFFEPVQYFHAMVEHFVDKGYVRGKSIVAAPYDWRYSPNGYLKDGYYDNLKNLIEKTFTLNNNTPVVLIAHSMGAPTTLYLLTKLVDQDWKDKYLKSYITISGVWRGAAKAAKAFSSGDNEGIIIDKNIWGRSSQRTYPSNAWLLPYPSDTWTSKEILVVTPTANYSAWDYEAFFKAMNYTRGYDMFNDIKDLTGDAPAPNVTTYCFYGSNVSTPLQFIYGPGEFPDVEPKVINGSGDGTVNIDSLLVCDRWKQQQTYPVMLQGFEGVEHVHTIKTPSVIDAVDKVVYDSYH